LSDDWDFYFARVDGAVSSIFVDLGMRPDVPLEKRPWLLWVFVTLEAPSADGLSTNDEAPALQSIGEALDANISAACGAQMVGRLTGSGRREFYFYGEEPGPLDDAVRMAMKAFEGYEHECGSALQPDWDKYLLLYPSDTNLQRMFNRRVLQGLAEQGDVHETPRQVDHWLEFAGEDARASCRDTLVAIDFKVEDEFVAEEPGAELPYALVVSRVDSVDSHTINGITLELARVALESGGQYRGWECPVAGADTGDPPVH
jgi:hypothetical protein